MATSVDSSLDRAPEPRRQQNSSDSNLQLPNVFVTPPPEEYDRPPWCCFDAGKDAQPGAFVPEDLEQDFDYAAHAEEEIFGRGFTYSMAENGERRDVFAMHSLVQEAEHLKEKLKALDLSAGKFSFTAPLPDEEDDFFDDPIETPSTPITTTTTIVSTGQAGEKVKRRKSLFSFRPLPRKKPFDETRSEIPVRSPSSTDLTAQASSEQDVASIASGSSRKSGIFSRFRLSSKKGVPGALLYARKSMNDSRSQEDLSSTPGQDVGLKRRFSFFGRRPSFSSQCTTTTTSASAASIVPSMNQSSSSLSTSSVPPTPDAGICNLNSPPSSPTERSSDKTSAVVDSSILTPMDALSVDNIAASLALPSSRIVGPDGQFMLDPLHFESLQFDSDDFA